MMEAALQEPDDWSQRRLCPDESCLGVIGPEGRCSVCGRGDAAAPQAQGPEPAPQADLQAAPEQPADEPADDFAERRLCPNESCLGLLGPDDRCKICGAPGHGDQPSP